MRRTSIAAAFVTTFLAGCASSSSEEPAPPVSEDDLAAISFPEMPGQPALCAAPTTFNLPDAAWASWFSNVTYSTVGFTANAIERNGFGKVGEGNTWVGEYSAQLLASLAGKPEAAAMKKALYETIHPDRGLEFLSVGSSQLTWADHRESPVSFLALRGTYALDDALLDLTAWLVPGPLDGKVHQGFYKAEQEIEALLDERLALMPRDQTIIVTGHSAGAAVGSLWVAHALSKGATQHFVIDSFGVPRIGDETFATAFEALMAEHRVPVVRFHNGKDPIPTQPGEFLGYRHVGLPVHLTPDGAEIDDSYVLQGLPNLSDHRKSTYFELTTERLLFQQPAYALKGNNAFASATVASLSECR